MSWGFQEKIEGVLPRELPDLRRGPNQNVLTLSPQGLFSKKGPVEFKRLRIVGDMESCSTSILCRHLMESIIGTWAYPSSHREIMYYNGNREINFKAISKTLGLEVKEAELGEGEDEAGADLNFLRHALLASLAGFLLDSGMQRVQIDHESDVCFARPKQEKEDTNKLGMLGQESDSSVLWDVVAFDNLVFSQPSPDNTSPPTAFLDVSAFVYRRRAWVEPDEDDPDGAKDATAVLVTPGFPGRVAVKCHFFIPEGVDKAASTSPYLFTKADLNNRSRGYGLYLPDTVQHLARYWFLRAGARLQSPRHLAQVTAHAPRAYDDEGRAAERTEVVPMELLAQSFTHCPSLTRTSGTAVVEALVVLLRRAPFLQAVEVRRDAPEPGSRGSAADTTGCSARPQTSAAPVKRVFQTAASLLKAKKAKQGDGGAAAKQKGEVQAMESADREYSSNAALDFSDSDFSDSDDDLN